MPCSQACLLQCIEYAPHCAVFQVILEYKIITKKKHNFELETSNYTVLCLDYAQNGIGSNSCGPELKKEYRLDEETFTFKVKLIPY